MRDRAGEGGCRHTCGLSAVSALCALIAGCAVPPPQRGIEVARCIPHLRHVTGPVYRGGYPGRQGVQALARLGVKSILNLDGEFSGEEPDRLAKERVWAEQLGIRLKWMPFHPAIYPTDEDLESAVEYVSDPANQPVFVHCDHGCDRTGLVIAAYRIKVDGWSPEKAWREMIREGFHFWHRLNWRRQFFDCANRLSKADGVSR